MTDPTAERIEGIVGGNDVVLFMKGIPAAPQCGFSAAVVQILSQLAVPFKGVDVLADQAIREGIKVYSDWPTIPQLYVKGEFVGGCDIVREMFQAGELRALMNEKGVAAAIWARPRTQRSSFRRFIGSTSSRATRSVRPVIRGGVAAPPAPSRCGSGSAQGSKPRASPTSVSPRQAASDSATRAR
jgi:monothiol glutaredoxin